MDLPRDDFLACASLARYEDWEVVVRLGNLEDLTRHSSIEHHALAPAVETFFRLEERARMVV
jgi:hypothetical protein